MVIRCHRCGKKISIDEAFAGGLCRCPYCKAITKVAARGPAAAERARVERPDMPEAPAAGPAARQTEPHEAMPVASPVLVQGVVALIMSALLLILLGAAAVAVHLVLRDRRGGAAGGRGERPVQVPATSAAVGAEENPFRLPGTRVAGMAFTAPVVFVIDASSGMRDCYDLAAATVRHAIRSMGSGDRLHVLLAREEGVERLSSGWTGGGEPGDAKARQFFITHQPAGATKLEKGVEDGLALAPRTLVVLAAKGVGKPQTLIQRAKGQGTAIHAVLLAPDAEAAESLRALAEQTGGHFRQFRFERLLDQLESAPLLP